MSTEQAADMLAHLEAIQGLIKFAINLFISWGLARIFLHFWGRRGA